MFIQLIPPLKDFRFGQKTKNLCRGKKICFAKKYFILSKNWVSAKLEKKYSPIFLWAETFWKFWKNNFQKIFTKKTFFFKKKGKCLFSTKKKVLVYWGKKCFFSKKNKLFLSKINFPVTKTYTFSFALKYALVTELLRPPPFTWDVTVQKYMWHRLKIHLFSVRPSSFLIFFSLPFRSKFFPSFFCTIFCPLLLACHIYNKPRSRRRRRDVSRSCTFCELEWLWTKRKFKSHKWSQFISFALFFYWGPRKWCRFSCWRKICWRYVWICPQSKAT